MGQSLKLAAIFVGVLLAQLNLAQYLRVGVVRPDFILVFLVFVSARYGRVAGIAVGFSAGLLQDLTGSLSVLGANTLAKSVLGYTLGTLNGTLTVWTPKIVNVYIYGALLGHAVVYQTIMSLGLQLSPALLANHILLETFSSSVMVTAMRYMLPLMPGQA